MAKSIFNGDASSAPAGDALAPLPGPAKPALDLSLGHFGTTRNGKRSFRSEEQVFRLVVDKASRTAVLHVNADAFESRAERRRAQKAFLKEATQLIAGMNLRMDEGGRNGL
jgi:hypothetical protein